MDWRPRLGTGDWGSGKVINNMVVFFQSPVTSPQSLGYDAYKNHSKQNTI